MYVGMYLQKFGKKSNALQNLQNTVVRFLPLVIDHYLGNKSLPW